MTAAEGYVSLAPEAFLRLLEEPFLYHRGRDELYELNEEAFETLCRCRRQGGLEPGAFEPEFLATCLDEGLLQLSGSLAQPLPAPPERAPRPSLRYMELQLTWRCNLHCRHCYLGSSREVDLPWAQVEQALKEFESLGGLRVLLSGGEPLLHPSWCEINRLLGTLSLRRVLLTNGLLLEPGLLDELQCDEVQVSLDGMRAGHETLRGAGTFDQTVQSARRVREAGRDLSIATMAHSRNLHEFEELSSLVRDLGAREWGIDVPCVAGRLGPGELLVTPAQAVGVLGHAFGGSYHGGSDGMSCGLHLGTVGANGAVATCGFYLDGPLGRLEEGLRTCWSRRKHLPLTEIRGCAGCLAAEECGGGCRFRAPQRHLPDPVMCAAFGVEPQAS
jgi:radical SAM protein with 4Fe4S-binding SPASM domain